MAKRKKTPFDYSQQMPYYVGRVIQRVSLLLAAGSTIILWGTLLAIAQGYAFTNSLRSASIAQLSSLSTSISGEVNNLINLAVILSLIALACTILMLLFPRVLKYEKKLVVDGVVIAAFLVITAYMSQSILIFILAHITG